MRILGVLHALSGAEVWGYPIFCFRGREAESRFPRLRRQSWRARCHDFVLRRLDDRAERHVRENT